MRIMKNQVGSETSYLRRFMVADESQCGKACLLEPECVAVSNIKIWVTYLYVCLLYDRVDSWSFSPKDSSNFYWKTCRNGEIFGSFFTYYKCDKFKDFSAVEEKATITDLPKLNKFSFIKI